MELVEALKQYVSSVNLSVHKYRPQENRPVLVKGRDKPISERKYFDEILTKAKITPPSNKELLVELFIESTSVPLMNSYLASCIEPEAVQEVPSELQGLTLNLDISNGDNFFMTDNRDYVSFVSADVYCRFMGIKEAERHRFARLVYPTYNPRNDRKIYKDIIAGYEGESLILNTYIPPKWKFTDPSENRCPKLFAKLVGHLVPNEKDRKYLLYWIRKSMVSRSMVYLVLCGAPGVGKNTLKKVLKALHGDLNTVDGKKSTITTQFNSQLSQGTLIWFDELKYNESEENFMKEIPNESISIESKGVDATRSTTLYGSYVISNNKPRDNYLSMDARKFVPITLTTRRLEESMTSKEIEDLMGKVDSSKPTYDEQFVSNLANWIINECNSDEWPNDEYKSSMFHILTHTSMSRWQKRVITIVSQLECDSTLEYKCIKATKDEINKFKTGKFGRIRCSDLELLSEANNKLNKTNIVFPEFSSVESFISYYRDLAGSRVFKVSKIPGDIYNDFYIEKISEKISMLLPEEVGKIGEEANSNAADYL